MRQTLSVLILAGAAVIAASSLACAGGHRISPLDGCVSGQTFAFPKTAAGDADSVTFKADGALLRAGGDIKWTWAFNEYTPNGKFGNLQLTSPAVGDPIRIPVTIGNDGQCVAHFLDSGDLDLGRVGG